MMLWNILILLVKHHPGEDNSTKEMVTPVIRASLEKQGYKVVGSHSGVKLCRWTKSQLRGRGGCYKHSFYGIESHRWLQLTQFLCIFLCLLLRTMCFFIFTIL